MSAITFDTLKFANTLKQAGVPDKQAEAEARAVADAIGEVDVATKRDIEDLKREMQAMELRLTVKLGSFLALAVGLIAALIKF